MSASRYAYLGGFDGTSNVAAGILNKIPVAGTHAHSFVSSYQELGELKQRMLNKKDSNEEVDFVNLCTAKRRELVASEKSTNEGELAAFIAYALAFPDGFLALVDTYDTLKSGLMNFLSVALALHQLGYTPRGIRLDSGDLAYFSRECRKLFVKISQEFNVPFEKLTIVASNDINEDVLYSLQDQGHEIDSFGIGTHLVTCQAQPALGCVYKLVEINGEPRIKVSEELAKVTVPGKKAAYRLYGGDMMRPMVDLMIMTGSQKPVVGRKVLCRHPFNSQKRVYVTPKRVEPLHYAVWDGKLTATPTTLKERRALCESDLASFRRDHIRRLNPTPYKVSVSLELFTFVNDLWQSEVPIPELS